MDQRERDLMEEVKAIIAEGAEASQTAEQPVVEPSKEEAKEATPDIKAGDNKTQENIENNETKSDKEVASLQDELLKGKNIADLEETAAGGNASAGGASNDGVSLSAASFVEGGHYSNINANFENLSSQVNASAEAFTNVSGGASEEGFTLETLEAAINNAYEVISQPENNEQPEPLEISVIQVDDKRVVGNTNEAISDHLDIEGNVLDHDVSERTGLHITNDNTPTLVGKATANATISVFDGEGEHAPLIGTTTADNDGNWSYTPTSPLADGNHKFTIEASKVAANGEEQKVTSTQDLTIDTVNNRLSVDDISVDHFDDLTQFHMFRYPDSVTSHIDDSTLINSMDDLDWTPTITGKAEAFADVNLEIWMKPAYWDPDHNAPDTLLTTVSVKADENGNWKAEDIDFKGKAYFDHAYEVKAVSSVDEAGNVADLSTPTTFYFPVPTAPEDHL